MQVGGDDIMDWIDLENLFDYTVEDLNVKVNDPPFPQDSSVNCYPESLTSAISEIEHLLMKDDGDDLEQYPYDDLLLDILLDSPVEHSESGEVVDVLDGRNLTSPVEEKNDGKEKEYVHDNNNDDDSNSKKRKRQLRNRDAAVRSRERKKTYVRDLQLKSSYFEGECKRLGMLLHCYLAENQALRNSLLMMKNSNKAFDDASSSMTKQESAVLLLESLLLGSLLWFPGIIIILCLLLLVRPVALEAAPRLEIVGNLKGGLKAAVPSSKVVLAFPSFMLGKRCIGSRSRMKPIPTLPYV